jgi:hypothetical protein
VNLYRETRESCDFGEALKDLDNMAQLRSSFADGNCNLLVPLIVSIWQREFSYFLNLLTSVFLKGMGRVLLNPFFGTILFEIYLQSHYTLFEILTCFPDKTWHSHQCSTEPSLCSFFTSNVWPQDSYRTFYASYGYK